MAGDLFDDEALRHALHRGLGWRAVRLEEGPCWAFEQARFGLRRWELGPMGLYAGTVTPCDWSAALQVARRRASSVRWQGSPQQALTLPAPAAAQAVADGDTHSFTIPAGYALTPRETHLLSIEPTAEAQRARYHATKRSQIARPALPDTEIAPGRAADLDDYWALYAESLRRWGRQDVPYPRVLFDALLDSPSVRLWTLRVQGRLAAAMVLLQTRPQALYWQGVTSSDAAFKPAFPMLRLVDAVLRGLSAHGVAVLNLGASEGLPQVRRFKEEFGAVATPYPTLAWDGLAWRAAQGLRRAALPIIPR